MENWQFATILLAAVFVGACLPALFQLMVTLRNLNKLIGSSNDFIRGSGRDLHRALDQVTEVASQMNRAGSTIESSADRIKSFFDALGSLTDWLLTLRRTLGVSSALGAALAPAVAEAIRAFREPEEAGTPESHVVPVPNPPFNGTDHMKEELRS